MDNALSEDRVARLGKELKRWEQQFAASHKGKKPGRDDIKKEAAIAAKYSEYQRLRTSRHNNVRSEGASKHSTNSPRHHNITEKHSKALSTPRKSETGRNTEQEPAQIVAQEDSTPAASSRQFVGPTPQKDGRVLGLFDISPPNVHTPSKPQLTLEKENCTGEGVHRIYAVVSTPSRTAAASPGTLKRNTVQQSTTKNSRTPQSSGKRFLLDSFVTPSKRRRLNEQGTPHHNTVRANVTGTPAYLQRGVSTLPSIHENASEEPSKLPFQVRTHPKRKSLTRSFSSMIADIRQAEDDRLDEELELLREMEADNAHEQAHTKISAQSNGNALVQDSQAVNTLDQDGFLEPGGDEDNEPKATDNDGKPNVFRKKKGQKRQTRRVIMKPRVNQPSSTQAIGNSLDKLDDGGRNEDEHQSRDESNADKDAVAQTSSAKLDVNKTDDPAQAESTVRKATKKISATAHANFRKLKIRSSKGAKAASAGQRRFGRGRR